MKSSIIITGMPGTGKTRLALNLGAALANTQISALILHTDILKVTLRQFREGLAGAGYSGDFYAKAQLIRPFLEAQVAKAAKDGYLLIVEGTLALGFCPHGGLHVLLDLAESERKQRISQKHFSAKKALELACLDEYRKALEASVTSATLRLDAAGAVSVLVDGILERVNGYNSEVK